MREHNTTTVTKCNWRKHNQFTTELQVEKLIEYNSTQHKNQLFQSDIGHFNILYLYKHEGVLVY